MPATGRSWEMFEHALLVLRRRSGPVGLTGCSSRASVPFAAPKDTHHTNDENIK